MKTTILLAASLVCGTSGIACAQANLTASPPRVGANWMNQTTVTVTVRNTGTVAETTFVDVFFDWYAAPPMIGDFGDVYRQIRLEPGESRDVTFVVPAEFVEWRHLTFVDVIVDTDGYVPETNEYDNTNFDLLRLYYFF